MADSEAGASAAAVDEDFGSDGELEDDDEGLVDLIDKISAVKGRFERFNKQMQAGSFGPDPGGFEPSEGEGPNETLDKKIERFEDIIGKLRTVVDRLEEHDPADSGSDDGAGGGGEAPRRPGGGAGAPGAQGAGGGRPGGEGEEEEEEEEDEFAETFATSGANPSVTEYEKLIQRLLVPFLDAVNAVGGDVKRQGAHVARAFGAQREMLEEVSGRAKPQSDEELMGMLLATQDALGAIDEINEGAGALRKHTAMVAGAMTAFGWVTAAEPRQYIGDMLNAVPVYGRQILQEHKGPEHAALVESLKYLLRGLQEYVGAYHPSGLAWDTKGGAPQGGPGAAGGAQAPAVRAPGGAVDSEARVEEAEKLSALDDFIFDRVVPFVESAYALGSDRVRAQTDAVQKVFKAQRDFMTYVVRCRRPRDDDVATLLGETSEALMEVEECCDNAADERLHLTMVAGGMAAMAWVSVPANPVAYIADMINSTPVYGDKILRETQESDDRDEAERHAAFVRLFRDMLKGLSDYVKKYHHRGLAWNMGGGDLADALAEDLANDEANATSYTPDASINSARSGRSG